MSNKPKKNNKSPSKDSEAEKASERKASIIVAVIVGAVGVLGTIATNWIIANSANAKRCDELEAVVSQKDALIAEKDARLADKSERIADQRAEISVLKQTVLMKDTQLDVKQSTITLYQLKAAEQSGRMVTRKDDEILKASHETSHGSIKDRLGIDDKRPILLYSIRSRRHGTNP